MDSPLLTEPLPTITLTNILVSLIIFVFLHLFFLFVLLKYIQSKFSDVRDPWFIKTQPLSFEDFFTNTVNRIASANLKSCNTYPDGQYCPPLGANNIQSLFLNPDAQPNTGSQPSDTYTITQDIVYYVSNGLYDRNKAMDLRTQNEMTGGKPFELSGNTIFEMSGVTLSDISGMIFDASGNLLGQYLPPSQPIDLSPPNIPQKFIIFIYIGLFVVFFLLTSPKYKAQTVLTIWEERGDFTFYYFLLGYFVLFMVIFIIVKHAATMKNGVKRPFLTAYLNKDNFDQFIKNEKQAISTIRSGPSFHLEAFQNLKDEIQGISASPANDDTDIHTKLESIYQRRNRKTSPAASSSFFDSIQKAVQSLLVKIYLPNENTVKVQKQIPL